MRVKLALTLFAQIIFVWVIAGCSRSVSHMAQITINLPKSLSQRLAESSGKNIRGESAQSDAPYLTHAAIQISAADISPAVNMIWDASGAPNVAPGIATAGAPASFSIEVPEGTNRLFQAVLVFKDAAGDLTFYYGNVTLTVDSTTDSVGIAANEVGAPTDGQGIIAGQYESTGGDLTGPITTWYTPPGQPPMIIDAREMFGGWFNVIALQNQAVSYELPDGSLMFGDTTVGGAVEAGTSLLTALVAGSEAYTNITMVSPPSEEYWPVSGSGDSCTLANPCVQPNQSIYEILGYFGPGATESQMICYWTGTSLNVQDMYDSDYGGGPTAWSGSFSYPEYGTSENVDSGTISDSATESNSICSVSGTQFQDYISVDPNQIANENDVIDTRGPFIESYQTGISKPMALDVIPATNSVTIDYQLLPDTPSTESPGGIDGIDFFYRAMPASDPNLQDYQTEMGAACGNLASLLPIPFAPVASQPVSQLTAANAGVVSSIPLPVSAIANSGAQLQIIACPYVGSTHTYFNTAAIWRSATQVGIVIPSQISAGAGSEVGPFYVQAEGPDGNVAPTLTTISGSMIPGEYGEFCTVTDGTCTTTCPAGPTAFSIAAGQANSSSQYCYEETDDPPNNTDTISFTGLPAGMTPTTLTFNVLP